MATDDDSYVKHTAEIITLLNTAPSADYDTERLAMRALHEKMHELIAARVSEPLNAKLAKTVKATRQEKSALAVWLNSEMRELGIAIRCPKTGGAASLHIGPGYQPAVGRFLVALIDSGGQTSSATSTTWRSLDFMGFPNRGHQRGRVIATPAIEPQKSR